MRKVLLTLALVATASLSNAQVLRNIYLSDILMVLVFNLIVPVLIA